MNTGLRKIFVQSEGRFFSDTESASIRSWAAMMPDRISAARAMELAEDDLVETVATQFMSRAGEQSRIKDALPKTERDLRLILRYIALAYVRDDQGWFQRAFAEWIAEIFRGFATRETRVLLGDLIRRAIDDRLDPAYARGFEPYTAILAEALAQ